ncbi:TetR/AcrR family transcriptional regulator [Thermodesulfobacteriota bacterium]
MSIQTDKKTTKAREIAKAALIMFARKGYAFTSIEQISSEAGIGKSTVYEYFKTKEELFVAAIMEGANEWIADMEAIGRETQDPIERLYRITELYTEKHAPEWKPDSRLFIEVLSQTFLQGGVFFDRPYMIRDLHQRIVRIVVDYLLAGVSRGQLRPDIARHAEKIAINFLAYLDGIKLHGMIEPGYIHIQEQVTLYMKHLEPLLKAVTDD